MKIPDLTDSKVQILLQFFDLKLDLVLVWRSVDAKGLASLLGLDRVLPSPCLYGVRRARLLFRGCLLASGHNRHRLCLPWVSSLNHILLLSHLDEHVVLLALCAGLVRLGRLKSDVRQLAIISLALLLQDLLLVGREVLASAGWVLVEG